MEIQWEKNCSRVDAVIKFYVVGNSGFETPNHESWLPAIIEKAFDGVTAPIDSRKDLAGVAPALKLAIRKLPVAMGKVELEKETQMPALLWMRLMRDNGITIRDALQQDLKQWATMQSTSRKMFLFLYANPDTGKPTGPWCSVDGLQRYRGLTAEELMVEKRQKLQHWPYGYEWIAQPRAHKNVAEKAEVRSPISATEHNSSERSPTTEREARIKVRGKRSTRSIEGIQKKWGTNVVAALQQCLASEVRSKRSVLQPGGRDARLYDCKLSLDDLVSKLKTKYVEFLGSCAPSTLKGALPAFVSCPRGRPKGILKPEAPTALKSPRIRR